jgi:hypothetical protein
MRRMHAAFVLTLAFVFTSAAAQTPMMYGTPQTAYDAPYGSTLTLNLPNGGTAVGADTIYIIEAALRGENSEFATPSGWSPFCSLQSDAEDQEQLFYVIYPSGATPPSSVGLTTNGSTWLGAIAVAYQGINAAAPFDAPNGWCSSNSALGTSEYGGPNNNPSSLTSVGVSNSVGNDLVLFSYFANGDVGTSQPAVSEGTLEAQVTRQQLDAYGYLGWVDMPMPGSGSSGTNTLSWVPGGGWGVGADGVLTMALAPAGSSPAEPPPMRPSTQAVSFGEQSVSAPPNPSPASISGGGHEMVSPENGSLNFSFQLPVPPGRQLTPDLTIAYNSSEARTVTSFGNEIVDYITEKDPVASDGWSYPVPSLAISTYDASPDGVEKCTVSTGYSCTRPAATAFRSIYR